MKIVGVHEKFYERSVWHLAQSPEQFRGISWEYFRIYGKNIGNQINIKNRFLPLGFNWMTQFIEYPVNWWTGLNDSPYPID